jgi:hypothetical protein
MRQRGEGRELSAQVLLRCRDQVYVREHSTLRKKQLNFAFFFFRISRPGASEARVHDGGIPYDCGVNDAA